MKNNTHTFTLYFKFEGTFLTKICKMQSPDPTRSFYFLLFYIRGHQQKTFVMFIGFWSLGRWGEGGLGESVKKGESETKIFFQKC